MYYYGSQNQQKACGGHSRKMHFCVWTYNAVAPLGTFSHVVSTVSPGVEEGLQVQAVREEYEPSAFTY